MGGNIAFGNKRLKLCAMILMARPPSPPNRAERSAVPHRRRRRNRKSPPWLESKSELTAIGGKTAVDERRPSPRNQTKARPEAARLRTASSPAGVVLLRSADESVDLQRFAFGRHDAAAEPANHLVHFGADDQGVGLGDSFEERDKLEVYCVG